MKKIASLFLIAALFYNALGLYIIFAEQQQQVWVAAMEQTYDSDFEVIEVAINSYGYIDDSGVEDANEDIVVNNKSYHIFKKRIQGNILKLYCLKNSDEKQLSTNLAKVVDGQFFDKDSNKEHSTKKVIKYPKKDCISYNPEILVTTITVAPVSVTVVSYPVNSNVLSGYFTLNYPPPNMA